MNDCYICKKHYSQGGTCSLNKKNCLLFEGEPRGKMIRTTFTFKLDYNAETSIIKYGSKVIFRDKGKDFEAEIIKINWINLETMTCNVEAEYHENEMPYCEKKKRFKIIKKEEN